MNQEINNLLKSLNDNYITISPINEFNRILYKTAGMKKDRHVNITGASIEQIEKYFISVKKACQDRLNAKANYKEEKKARCLSEFESLKIGDIVYNIEGYSCTLYQFYKVISKTAKTVTYRSFGYRGMCATWLPEGEPEGEFITKNYTNLFSNRYNPDSAIRGHYDNNSD